MLTKQFYIICSIHIVLILSLYYFWVSGQDAYPERHFLPPFVDFDRGYTIAPSHNLSICCIKKSMSTLMMGIACALFDTKGFMAANQSLTSFWNDDRYCLGKNEYSRLEDVEQQMTLGTDYTKVAAIREPIDRFVSFFVDKCIHEAAQYPEQQLCFDCKGDLRCFLERQYDRFMRHSKGEIKKDPSYDEMHAAPLTWSCEFGRYLKEYKIVKMSANREDRKEGIEHLLDILRTRNVSDSTLDFFRTSALSGDTTHATYASDAHKTVQQQIETDREIRQLLKKMYYYDFLIFGFDTTFIDS